MNYDYKKQLRSFRYAWQGIRSSRAYGPTCPQAKRMGWYSDELAFSFNWDDGFPDEDCLRVNVWTPGVNDQKKRPVMVWLHGGGFAGAILSVIPRTEAEEFKSFIKNVLKNEYYEVHVRDAGSVKVF